MRIFSTWLLSLRMAHRTYAWLAFAYCLCRNYGFYSIVKFATNCSNLWRDIKLDFQNVGSPSWICYTCLWDRQQTLVGGSYCCAKFGWNRRLSFENMRVITSREFAWKRLFQSVGKVDTRKKQTDAKEAKMTMKIRFDTLNAKPRFSWCATDAFQDQLKMSQLWWLHGIMAPECWITIRKRISAVTKSRSTCRGHIVDWH